ncbi:MAG TPA: hypothetical protein VKU82_04865, partial [Planctomycetaceae bacterium]|nr:hypothetical protein [Planctomycetaceae bacterium]
MAALSRSATREKSRQIAAVSVTNLRWLLNPAVVAMLFAAGCQDKPAGNQQASGTASKALPAQEEAQNQCEPVLASIDDIFQLQRLGRTTAVRDGVARLNDWQRLCGPEDEAARPALPPEVEKLCSSEQIKALSERRFGPRDGEHLRDCLLERAIARYAVGNTQNELEKITHLFGHVVRSVGLISEASRELPLTPYEIYLLGKGTAQDRAWIFINVLRQMRIDAVLIFPASADVNREIGSEGEPFLVGVLLDDQVFLFDPQSGVAIPKKSGADGRKPPEGPVTLVEAATDSTVFQQLGTGPRPYPIRAEDVARPIVAIAGDTSFWSGRMQALQAQFVGDRALVIADPLENGKDGSPGIWSRVAKAGGEFWSSADMRLWSYPETRLARHVQMSQSEEDALTGLMRPFGAYKNVVTNPSTGKTHLVEREATQDPAGDKEQHPDVHVNVRTTAGQQMRARLAQLSGDFVEAIRTYTEVR